MKLKKMFGFQLLGQKCPIVSVSCGFVSLDEYKIEFREERLVRSYFYRVANYQKMKFTKY